MVHLEQLEVSEVCVHGVLGKRISLAGVENLPQQYKIVFIYLSEC